MGKNKIKGKARTKLMKKETRIAQKALSNKTNKRRSPSAEAEAFMELEKGYGEC